MVGFLEFSRWRSWKGIPTFKVGGKILTREHLFLSNFEIIEADNDRIF